MWLTFAIALCASRLGQAVSTQMGLLARSRVQGLTATAAVGGRADLELGIGASLTSTPSCDSQLSGPICFSQAGRQQALMPNAVPSGLVAHYDFDADMAIDSSGNGNHAVTELVHGPSPVGSGHSAAFTRSFMMVPNSALLDLTDFTYSFWVYLLDDGVGKGVDDRSPTWCPLIRKGIHMESTEQFASAPALLFNHRTGHLRAEVTTSLNNLESGEHADSNARLLPNRWMHFAMVHHSSHKSLLLYVNGILDRVIQTQGTLSSNDYPLYVGGDPFTPDCAFTTYIDELRVYSHAVPPHLLQAEAAPALGGTDPSYVRLGCTQCSLAEASRSCPPNRHVCTTIELHTGGYQVARSLGWLAAGTHVWNHAAVVTGAAGEMASPGAAPAPAPAPAPAAPVLM